jgi:hypothetical protein
MIYTCNGCHAIVDAAIKPKACPMCGKYRGFAAALAGPRAPAYESEWDAAAWQVMANANIHRPYTFATLANQHGLPDVSCLTALYEAIPVPGNAGKKRIAFYAFGAEYDQKLQIKLAVNNKSYPMTGQGACVCAEHGMWADVGPKVKDSSYIGIGQTVCPCKLCMARYSALARTYNAHIMVCWAEVYDSQPPNSWLIFPRTTPGDAYGGA